MEVYGHVSHQNQEPMDVDGHVIISLNFHPLAGLGCDKTAERHDVLGRGKTRRTSGFSDLHTSAPHQPRNTSKQRGFSLVTCVAIHVR